VAPGRQVQQSVLEVQVPRSVGPTREPGDGHGPDDARKTAAVTCLDRLASDALGIDDTAGTALTRSAQVQAIPEQLAEQVPAPPGRRSHGI
jgi:hypothetical protein